MSPFFTDYNDFTYYTLMTLVVAMTIKIILKTKIISRMIMILFRKEQQLVMLM